MWKFHTVRWAFVNQLSVYPLPSSHPRATLGTSQRPPFSANYDEEAISTSINKDYRERGLLLLLPPVLIAWPILLNAWVPQASRFAFSNELIIQCSVNSRKNHLQGHSYFKNHVSNHGIDIIVLMKINRFQIHLTYHNWHDSLRILIHKNYLVIYNLFM